MIACTSADVPMERLLEAGMQDILRKPARMPALRHLLQKWIPAQPSPGIELLPPPLRRGSSTLGAFAARVLHVEPCPITASNTQCLMQQLGVWVDSVETGEQAMRHLDKSGRRGDGASSPRRVYDLVLVEMALPGMSGYALASWYRDLCAREDDGRPRADVAALTAEPDATLCAEFGIDFCLPKPLTADMCARVLCEWIKERNERLGARQAPARRGDDADSFARRRRRRTRATTSRSSSGAPTRSVARRLTISPSRVSAQADSASYLFFSSSSSAGRSSMWTAPQPSSRSVYLRANSLAGACVWLRVIVQPVL